MDFSTILPGLIGAVGVPLGLYILGLVLPRKRTYDLGYKAGRFLTMFGQRKLGAKSWEKAEKKIQSTVNDFIEGIHAGLDSDDANKP